MNSFTPGPWTRVGLEIFGDTGRKVAWLPALGLSVDTSERDANARLIAAAPDILDALSACLVALEEDEDVCGPNGAYDVAIDLAHAAIAKARGETVTA